MSEESKRVSMCVCVHVSVCVCVYVSVFVYVCVSKRERGSEYDSEI